MKDRVTKNYFTDNGDTLVIGGKLIVEENATVTGLEDDFTPAAKQTDIANDAQLADVITAFNGLLSAMKTAGLMVST
ncbi:MAG: Head fiber protein [Clostridia bacterium]|nr:Head fiber protein [Clostridia bacterium]